MKDRVIQLTAVVLLASMGCAAASAVQSTNGKWPRDSSGALVAGTAIVLADIDGKGNVKKATIDTSTGNNILDGYALATVRRWHFTPRVRNGEAVETKAKVPVRMSPNGASTTAAALPSH